MSALSSALGQAFVSTPHSLPHLCVGFFWVLTREMSTEPLLVWNYGAIAVLAFLAGCVCMRMTRNLDRAETMDRKEGVIESKE